MVGFMLWLVVGLGALWAFGALWFDFPHPFLGKIVAGVFGLAMVLAWILVKPRWRARLGSCITILLVLAWWLTIKPQHHRDWRTDVAVLPHADITDESVTIHNVRNFEYRTAEDFTPHYETRTYQLSNLRGMDAFINYWGSPYMAHPIVSFDFGEDGRICFSIETRPEQGEAYSAIGGLYRQFELIYIAADERDVVRVRTNYRTGEDVYLYHLTAPGAKSSFLEYARSIKELSETPRWYNAITNNCTTAIRHQRASGERGAWDWRMLVNGFMDELMYEKGAIDRSLPFDELKRRSHINPSAKAADQDPDFSKRIREGLPGMQP